MVKPTSKFSNLPSLNGLLVETFPRLVSGKKDFLVCYTFEEGMQIKH